MRDWRSVALLVAAGITGASYPGPAGERHEINGSVNYGYKSVVAIHVAESQSLAGFGTYASLAGLAPGQCGLISSELARGDSGPYRLEVRRTSSGYSVKATPKQACRSCPEIVSPEIISDETMRIVLASPGSDQAGSIRQNNVHASRILNAMRSLPKGPLLALAAMSALAAQLSYQQLFDRASANVSATLKRLPEYTCVETQDRTHSRLPRPASGCERSAEAAARSANSRLLLWRDRLRVEVAEGAGSEMFSWVGDRTFNAMDVHQLMDLGVTGTGDFSAFLKTIFSGGADHFQYRGEQKTPAGTWAVYDYSVPLARSQYVYSDSAASQKTIGYHGSLFIDAGPAQLQRLDVTAEGFVGHVCKIDHEIDYATVKVGDTDIRLPKESTMTVLYDDGEEAVNRTRYSGCRRYEVQSSLSFGNSDAPATNNDKSPGISLPPIPANATLEVAFESSIDSSTAAAGDPVTAVVKHDAATRNGDIVARKGDLLHGRLLRVEETIGMAIWIVTVRLDEIERAGVRQPIKLRPLDDGERLLTPRIAQRIVQRDLHPAIPPRPPNAGVFVLEGDNHPTLDNTFQSRWITQ